jgi:hypothetical protein
VANVEETKKCPKCKEEIAKDAKKCKHCGTDLRNWFVRHKVMTVILALIVIGIIATAAGSGNNTSNKNENKTDNSTEETKTATKVETASFIGEFDKNQLSAEEKYKNKLVEFTAVIDNISEDITSTAYLSLKPTNDQYYVGTSVSCYFKSKSDLTSLSNGQSVKLQGTVKSQSLGIIQIEDCKVIK